MTMVLITSKPTQRKGRGIGSANDNGPRFFQVFNQRTVLLRDVVFQCSQSIGRRKAFLININLDTEGYACQNARVFSPFDSGINPFRSGHCLFRHLLHDRIDFRIDDVQSMQCFNNHFRCAYRFITDSC